MTRVLTGLIVAAVLILVSQIASAMITGIEGNEPIDASGFPKGAGAIINRTERIAWWDHSGDHHAEGRGNVKVINEILADFGKLDVKTRRVIVHDGIGQSYLLNIGGERKKRRMAQIDWAFMVWLPDSWENIRKQPRWMHRIPPEEISPPSQIDIYTANIRWADVIVPEGIEVIDQRLEAHGFTDEDGIVIEGQIKDLQSGQPIIATVRVQRMDTKKGKQVYTNIVDTKSNAEGKWVFKKLEPGSGWVRVVTEADGYAPRVVGHGKFDDHPQWRSYDSGLMQSVSVSGRIIDEAGKPLAEVEVRLHEVYVDAGREYESPSGYELKSDNDGRFQFDQVPKGEATVWLHKPGHYLPRTGRQIKLPGTEIELRMLNAGSIRVTVDFNGQQRPKEYMVDLEPEGGNVVGSYGGSANIDGQNGFTFKNVPPGKYVVKGHPNPYSEKQISEPVAIDLLQGNNAADVTIKAK